MHCCAKSQNMNNNYNDNIKYWWCNIENICMLDQQSHKNPPLTSSHDILCRSFRNCSACSKADETAAQIRCCIQRCDDEWFYCWRRSHSKHCIKKVRHTYLWTWDFFEFSMEFQLVLGITLTVSHKKDAAIRLIIWKNLWTNMHHVCLRWVHITHATNCVLMCLVTTSFTKHHSHVLLVLSRMKTGDLIQSGEYLHEFQKLPIAITISWWPSNFICRWAHPRPNRSITLLDKLTHEIIVCIISSITQFHNKRLYA